MKKLFKKAVLGGVVLSLGLAVGYAASTAFQDLDAIRDNFDYILGLNTSKQEEIDRLNLTISGLQDEIEELEQNQNNSGKQEEIKELEEQVADLIAERDKLETERDNAIDDNLELEKAINDLKVYTDMFIDVEVEAGE